MYCFEFAASRNNQVLSGCRIVNVGVSLLLLRPLYVDHKRQWDSKASRSEACSSFVSPLVQEVECSPAVLLMRCESLNSSNTPHFAAVTALALTVLPAALSCQGEQEAPAVTYLGSIRDDGFGAQVQNKVACMLEAKTTPHHVYVHKPFHIMHFVPERDLQYVEEFLNLGAGEVTVDSLTAGKTAHLSAECYKYGDANVHLWHLLRPLLRQRLFSDKAAHPNFRSKTVRIAIHVRRGFDAGKGVDRFTDIAKYSTIARIIAETLSSLGMNAHFAVYSTGHLSDFKNMSSALTGHTVKLHLGKDIESADLTIESDASTPVPSAATQLMLDTWLDLVNADILLMSKSSFSHSAALYSNGVVLYPPYWHKQLPDWVCIASKSFQDDLVQSIKSKRHQSTRV